MSRNHIGAFIGVVLLMVSPARATTARCNIEKAGALLYTFFEGDCGKNNPDVYDTCGFFNIPGAAGRFFDVTFDNAGTFTLDGTGWGGEISFVTVGVNGFMTVPAVTKTGTIDAGGNVMIPGFSVLFDTDFCANLPPPSPPRCGVNTETFNLTTAMGHVAQAGTEWLAEGIPLDFGSGELVMEGHDVSTLVAPQVSGLRVHCKLDTIPAPTDLPKAPVLASAKGKVTGGGDIAAGSSKGDHLTLAAKLVASGLGVVPPATNDLFLKISAPDGSTVGVVLVKGSDLTQKKKAFLVNDAPGTLAENGDVDDPDGSKLQILYGQKKTGNLLSTAGGKLTLKAGKKFTTLSLSLDGLDLTKLLATDATTGAFRLQIGRDSAVKSVALKATKGGRKFH